MGHCSKEVYGGILEGGDHTLNMLHFMDNDMRGGTGMISRISNRSRIVPAHLNDCLP
jgi:hypothetical protein